MLWLYTSSHMVKFICLSIGEHIYGSAQEILLVASLELQGSLLSVLGRPYEVLGIELELVSYKASVLTTVLSLQSLSIHIFNAYGKAFPLWYIHFLVNLLVLSKNLRLLEGFSHS